MATEDGDPPRRRTGRPAQIDRAAILRAARDIDPSHLTMRAVADLLGVDPTSLNYHVGGRGGLLRLVATDAFLTRLAVGIPDEGPWSVAAARFAQLFRDALLATGPLVDHVRFDGAAMVRTLAPVETLLRTLEGAGFDPEDAARFVTLLITVALQSARETLAATPQAGDPHLAELRQELDRAGAASHPETRRRLDADVGRSGANQFAFEVQTVIAGFAGRLPAGGA
jgi:AcrR family transcriptional regulator